MEPAAAMIMTTVRNRDDAAVMARSLIGKKLAACVQEIGIHSHFNWEGKTTNEPEVLLLIKTAQDRVDDAMSAIREAHSYDIPEILVAPIVGGLGAYLQWVRDETR